MKGGKLSNWTRRGEGKITEKTNLDLETDVDVGSVDGRRPPESEPSVRDLVETRSLSVGDWSVEEIRVNSSSTRRPAGDED